MIWVLYYFLVLEKLGYDDAILKRLEEIAFSSTTNVDLSSFNWIKQEYVEVEKGVLINVYMIKSSVTSNNSINVVVVPGLCSHFFGWLVTDYVLSRIGNVYHVESREKSSAIYQKKNISYTLDTFAKDLHAVVKKFNLEESGFYFVGDSFGAEMVIRYLYLGFPSPKGLILISPVKRFSFSLWMKILFLLVPHWFFQPFLPFIRFVLKNFRTDMKKDAITYYINRRNVETGNSKRMKGCALELSRYSSNVDYSKIKCPVYIIAASTDKMHDFNQSKEISSKISNVKFEDVVFFAKTHMREVAEKMIEFIMAIEEQKD